MVDLKYLPFMLPEEVQFSPYPLIPEASGGVGALVEETNAKSRQVPVCGQVCGIVPPCPVNSGPHTPHPAPKTGAHRAICMGNAGV